MDKHLMSHKELIKRLHALESLLDEAATTKEKFESVRKIARGVNPEIDKALDKISALLKKIDKIEKGKIIELSAEALPDGTEEQKKRKKFILLLITRWKSLKSEVKRIRKELENQTGQEDTLSKVKSSAKIITFAKGPLGIITILAAVIAGVIVFLNSWSAEIVIMNESCDEVTPTIPQNISLPGLKLPGEPIPRGGSAKATVPPLKFTVDGTQNPIQISAYGLNFRFNLTGGGINVIFNSTPIIGQKSQIDLGSRKSHELIFQCER